MFFLLFVRLCAFSVNCGVSVVEMSSLASGYYQMADGTTTTADAEREGGLT